MTDSAGGGRTGGGVRGCFSGRVLIFLPGTGIVNQETGSRRTDTPDEGAVQKPDEPVRMERL